MIDIPNFRDSEIVDILSGTVDSNIAVNLKTFHRAGVTRSNTNNTIITETSFDKSKPPENDKTDSRIKEEKGNMYNIHCSNQSYKHTKFTKNELGHYIAVESRTDI